MILRVEKKKTEEKLEKKIKNKLKNKNIMIITHSVCLPFGLHSSSNDITRLIR